MTPDELQEYLGRRQTTGVLASEVSHGDLRLTLDADAYVEVAQRCRTDERLGCDFFDTLFGIDARDEGFDVVTVLYSIQHRHRVILKHRCAGGRGNPVAPTLTHIWRGANWHERETWDMFGIEFDGHPGLAPRILNVENFEGWPLRKDFYLASRVAKPWPGVKEPAETDEEGNVIEREAGLGDAPGPTDLDKAMADHAKSVNVVVHDAAAPKEIEEPEAEPAPAEEPEARAEPEAPADEPAEEVVEEPEDEVVDEPVEEVAEEPAEETVEELAEEPADEPEEAAEEPTAEDTADTPKAVAVDDDYEGELPEVPVEDDPSSAERNGEWDS
jgi:NADH-quinone oxidoreductase subunit C